jgi:hypothetical protein
LVISVSPTTRGRGGWSAGEVASESKNANCKKAKHRDPVISVFSPVGILNDTKMNGPRLLHRCFGVVAGVERLSRAEVRQFDLLSDLVVPVIEVDQYGVAARSGIHAADLLVAEAIVESLQAGDFLCFPG